jgi:hypothetical protein
LKPGTLVYQANDVPDKAIIQLNISIQASALLSKLNVITNGEN